MIAAVSKTMKPSAPVVVSWFWSARMGILPLGFRVLTYHGSFCLLVWSWMCSTLVMEIRCTVRHQLSGERLICAYLYATLSL